ncbi:hypothetical protein [Dactylosporangium sp. CA-139066]|uniref:hypothetical protein n=1 Tax=Dactylosporangium sp. CA-139066 TaxID=3239930 RepID=UPI003D90A415
MMVVMPAWGSVVAGVEGEHGGVAGRGGRDGGGAVGQPQVAAEQVVIGEVLPGAPDLFGVPVLVHVGGDLHMPAADDQGGCEGVAPGFAGVVVDDQPGPPAG